MKEKEIEEKIFLISKKMAVSQKKTRLLLSYFGVYGFNESFMYNSKPDDNIFAAIRESEMLMDYGFYSEKSRKAMYLQQVKNNLKTLPEILKELLPFSDAEVESLERNRDYWGNAYLERGLENIALYFPNVLESL